MTAKTLLLSCALAGIVTSLWSMEKNTEKDDTALFLELTKNQKNRITRNLLMLKDVIKQAESMHLQTQKTYHEQIEVFNKKRQNNTVTAKQQQYLEERDEEVKTLHTVLTHLNIIDRELTEDLKPVTEEVYIPTPNEEMCTEAPGVTQAGIQIVHEELHNVAATEYSYLGSLAYYLNPLNMFRSTK